MMIADIVAAVRAAKVELEKHVAGNAYFVVEYEETAGEIEYGIDTIKVTGFRIDADVTNVVFEYECGDIDEMTLSEFASNVYATAAAAIQEMERIINVGNKESDKPNGKVR